MVNKKAGMNFILSMNKYPCHKKAFYTVCSVRYCFAKHIVIQNSAGDSIPIVLLVTLWLRSRLDLLPNKMNLNWILSAKQARLQKKVGVQIQAL